MAARLFAVGDIHGEYAKLDGLLSALDLKAQDTVVFIGDYIDRGPKSKEVVDRLLALSTHCHCIFLRGNHEAMMENALKNASALELWLYNGGTATLRSYGGMENILKLHGPFYASLRNSFETDDFIFVHAGLRPGIEAKDQDPQDLVWIREEFIYEQTGLKKTVVYGHSPVQMYQSPYPDKIGIDTGAAYGGPLSAIELPQKKWRRFPDV